jgi:hypothetical protein
MAIQTTDKFMEKIILQKMRKLNMKQLMRENLLKNILSVNSIFSDAFINDGYYKNISLMVWAK